MTKNWTRTRKPTFNKDSALHMDNIAKTVFKPIYPVIVSNALEITGICRGKCLDLGTGPAMMAMAVARALPEMSVTAFDFSEGAQEIAEANICEAKLEKRISTAFGDVHDMPFEDQSFDLIISRGSMFFWDDLKTAFAEIIRILAPGGATYIGGGFGSLALREQVIKDMAKVDPNWNCYAKKEGDTEAHRRFDLMFEQLDWETYQVIDDDTGFWVMVTRPA